MDSFDAERERVKRWNRAVDKLFSRIDEPMLRPDSLLGQVHAVDDNEFYVGGGHFVHCTVRSFETWLDLHEWVESQPNTWDIDTIRVWNGPGSMLSAIFIFVRYENLDPEED